MREELERTERLLSLFPSQGRDERTTALLLRRRAAIEKRLQLLRQQLEDERRKRREASLEASRRAAEVAEELARAPRCVLVHRFVDEDGEPLPEPLVLARVIGGIDPQNPLVVYRDYGGCGGWEPVLRFPPMDVSKIPPEVRAEIERKWQEDSRSWESFISSLEKREERVVVSYERDDETVGYSEDLRVFWVTPEGEKYEFLPPPPSSLEDRLERWWVRHVAPEVEATWVAQAREYLSSLGWVLTD